MGGGGSAPPPINCVVSDWSPWGPCSAYACGTSGTQTQSRTIKTAAANGGTACPALTQTQPCQAPPCPVECVVSDWAPFGPCSATACGTTGTKSQTRTITTQPANGGAPCPSLTNTVPCSAPACPAPAPASILGSSSGGSNKTVLIGVGVTVALILVIAIVLLVVMKKKKPAATTGSSTTAL